jgi:hypothetical protein
MTTSMHQVIATSSVEIWQERVAGPISTTTPLACVRPDESQETIANMGA